MKIFYHADLDGKCSAAIIDSYYCNNSIMIPYSNGKEIPFRKMKDGETVFFLDCSLPIQEMQSLSHTYNLIWIDHHASSIDEADRYGFDPEGIRSVDKAACELTWEYIVKETFHEKHKTKIPYGIQLIGRYDIWDLNFSKELVPYNYGISSLEHDPRTIKGMNTWSEIVFSYDKNVLKKVISDGQAIERYLSQINNRLMNSYSFPTIIEGKKALAVNRQFVDSSAFKSRWDNTKYDLMVAFAKFKESRLGFCWKVSLYSDKKDIDVSKIACKYGGGGHKDAAGFITPILPFKTEEQLCLD